MGEVIAFADIVLLRRRRTARRVHARCLEILIASAVAAAAELAVAPAGERAVRARRQRKLDELVEYATAAG